MADGAPHGSDSAQAPGQPGPWSQPSWNSPLAAPPGWGGPGAGPPPGRRPGDRRAVVPLRPLGLGELLDGAVSVVRGYPRPVFAVGALVALVGAALQLLVVLTLLRPLLRVNGGRLSGDLRDSADVLGGAAAGSGITVLFATFSALLLAGLVAPAVSRGLLGRPLPPGQAWEQLRPRIGALVGVSLLVTLTVFGLPALGIGLTAALAAVGGGTAALAGIVLVPVGLVAGVVFYVRWAFAPLCVVLEKQGVRASLRRSSTLVARSWWRVLGVLALTALVAGVVAEILQLPFQFLGRSPGSVLSGTDTSTSVFVVSAIGTVVSATVVGPFSACVRGLLYADRRMRAEGLDVALAAAVAAPGAPDGT